MAPLPHPAPASHPPSSVSTTTPQPPTANTSKVEPPAKKRKTAPNPSTLHTSTFRQTTYTYFHLRLNTPHPPSSPPSSSSSSPADLDPLTIRSLLTPPLQAYLGLTGAAIPIDILKSEARDVWIRVHGRDAKGVQASLSAWAGTCEGGMVPGTEEGEQGKRIRVSWRVVDKGGRLDGGVGDGSDLFG